MEPFQSLWDACRADEVVRQSCSQRFRRQITLLRLISVDFQTCFFEWFVLHS
jgi:hypothetical protein